MWISDVMIPWSLALVLVVLLNLKADEGLPDIQDVCSPRQSTAAVHPYFVFACGLQQRHISSSWRKMMMMFVCQCCIKCRNWTHADSSFSCLSLFLWSTSILFFQPTLPCCLSSFPSPCLSEMFNHCSVSLYNIGLHSKKQMGDGHVWS